MAARRKPSVDVRQLVLHEAGYRCAVPACRQILTLDIHHLVRVSDGGGDGPENLLPLCPTCHALHHRGEIPQTSIRAWKMLLLSLNTAFDQRCTEALLLLDRVPVLWAVTGDGVLACASLVSSGFVEASPIAAGPSESVPMAYTLRLTDRGRQFVEAWKAGDQNAAAGSVRT